MKRSIPLLLAFSWLGSAAFSETVLLVERKQDRRDRTRVEARLRSIRVDFSGEDLPVREFARWLGVVTGEGIDFMVAADGGDDELPTITLQLEKVRLDNLLRVVADVTGLGYVYRNGVVMIKPKEQIKEMTELRLYDVRAMVAPITDFPAPELLGLRPSGYEPPEREFESSERTLSGFGTEDLAELVRNNVSLGNWDSEGVSLTASNGILIIRQTERGHAQVSEVLRVLGYR